MGPGHGTPGRHRSRLAGIPAGLPKALRAALSENFPLSAESFRLATDSRAILEARATPGSANPAMAEARLRDAEAEVREAESKLRAVIGKQEAADRALEAAAKRLLES